MMNDVLNMLASSSAGNCYIYFNEIMIDIGVPYATLKKYNQNIKYILLSHAHS